MNEVVIDGIRYVKEDMLKDNMGIMDAGNISMVLRFKEEWIKDGILTLPYPKLSFKHNGVLSELQTDWDRSKIFTKNGTKISYDIYVSDCMIANGLELKKNNKLIDFDVWESWDIETKAFKKDYPVAFLWGNTLILIAPRVDVE